MPVQDLAASAAMRVLHRAVGAGGLTWGHSIDKRSGGCPQPNWRPPPVADGEAAKPRCTGQDETGRRWDVLTVARWAIAARGGCEASDRLAIRVLQVPPTGRGARRRLTTLHLVAGPVTKASWC